MRITGMVAAVATATAVGFWTAPAAAQQGDEAKKSFEKGVALYNEGDYQGALAEFLSAYEAKPHHSVLYNIAQCYQMTDAGSKALHYYEQYLEDGADFIKEKRKNQVLEEIGKLKALLTPTTVNATPDGAEVFVDGKSAGKAPLPDVLYLDPGEHVISVEMDGHVPQKQEFVAKRGEAMTFEIALAAEAVTGTIAIESAVGGATATVDGVSVGVLPAEKIVDAGEHEIVVSAAGHEDAKKTVVVEKGGKAMVALDPLSVAVAAPVPEAEPEPAKVEPIAKKPEKSKKAKDLAKGAIASGVFALLAAGGAAASGISASNEENDFKVLVTKIGDGSYTGSDPLKAYHDSQDTGRLYNGAFMVFLGIAVVDVVAMLVLAPLAAKAARDDGGGGDDDDGGGEAGPEKAKAGPKKAEIEVVPGAGGAAVKVAF